MLKTHKTKLAFIFAGRLTIEKGFDLILELFETIQKKKQRHSLVHFHVFGDCPLAPLIPQYHFVTYHGFQHKDTVLEIRKTCHYALMPSRFLETFGLSALDSLQCNVPVIGSYT